ncbi:CHAT domain-containing protein [Alphaproteobacteria bacterium]|nr:CHAT domain-containing protein [Alphaproteobacteria bacterium]
MAKQKTSFLLFLGFFLGSFWLGPTHGQTAHELVKAGKAAYLEGLNDRAYTSWKEAEKLGNVDAAYYLGWLHTDGGRGIPYDELKAIKFFHSAAKQGHVLAAIELAAQLEEKPNVKNMGTPEEWHKAVKNNLSKIIAQSKAGDPFAQTSLGFLYGFGIGVTKDPKKYVFWQRAAADQGFAAGQYHLSYALESGTGIKKNPELALQWMQKAAGQDENNEGLSGLARAFLYAGSRALLVSHWPVETISAKKLTVGIFKQLRAEAKIGRAEALRRSIGALVDNSEPHFAHPAFWAPFVLVGDGRRGS